MGARPGSQMYQVGFSLFSVLSKYSLSGTTWKDLPLELPFLVGISNSISLGGSVGLLFLFVIFVHKHDLTLCLGYTSMSVW